MPLLTVALCSGLALFVSFVLFWGVGLFRNYLAARKLGVPIRVIPIDHINPIWMLIDRWALAVLNRALPFIARTSFYRYNFRGWELSDRYRTHQELGDAFMLVTPGRNWFYLADPDVLMDVFRRRTDFPRCLELTGTCFNEQNHEIVWSQSTVLARSMLQNWTTRPSVDTIAPDTRSLSLGVLVRAGFGESATSKLKRDHGDSRQPTNFQQSLQTILENCILIMALGPSFLADWKAWLPQKLIRLHEACSSFQRHMTDLYEAEKRLSSSSSRDHNLMASLVRAGQDDAKSAGGLTEQEIYANMFVLNFAGHDTTAHTFTFSLYLLAAHPAVQDWVSEELRRVLGDRPPDEWHYNRDFPRLKRCLAVLYETLRLYTPVPVAKWTESRPQTLVMDRGDGSKTTIVLPPRTMVIPAYSAVQTNPKYWGAEALRWRPERWIRPRTSSGGTSKDKVENLGKVEDLDLDEDFLTPRPGTFLGWSEGARDCPGRKFSQVEFVATMAVLFRHWRVEPMLLEGEVDADAARERVLRQIESDSAPVLLLQMPVGSGGGEDAAIIIINPPSSPWGLSIIILSLCLGIFLFGLDINIIGTAIPQITTEFRSLHDMSWYGSVYLLTVTAFQPLFGNLYKYFSAKVVYLASLLIFEAGSIVCAAAPRSAILVLGRALLGLGAAGLLQGALAIIGHVVRPLDKVPLYQGIVVSALGVSVCVGPVIGGALTEYANWPIMFLVPITQSTNQTTSRQLSLGSKLQRMDFPGIILFIGAVFCLLLALTWGGQVYPWSDSRCVGLLVGFGLLSGCFCLGLWKQGEVAIIPLRVLRQRSIWTGALVLFGLGMASQVYAYYLPVFFQSSQGVSTTESGVRFIALIVPQIASLVLVGAVVSKLGHYVPFIIGGIVIMCTGAGLLTILAIQTPTAEWATFLVICGIGMGMAQQLPYTAVQTVLDALGIAIGQNIFLLTLRSVVPRLTTGEVSPDQVFAAGPTNLESLAPGNADAVGALREAYAESVRSTLTLALVAACLALPPACFMERRNIKRVSEERRRREGKTSCSEKSKEDEKEASRV
ncbi:cytochrome P450 [Rhypophila decipiens]|uniref:Cytochrome P450 n=1 Tax=Rhypophila decipiens TaxID=261697 RepID=A0AAN6XWF3_9PEZI|nr:cytochrome P450 [Rhypophila decipiens]